METRVEATLQQPVDRVFAYLADPRNRPDWQSSIRWLEMIDDGEPRIGMRWRERATGFGTFDMEIVAFERDRTWAESGSSRLATIRVELSFDDLGAATRVGLHARVDLRGPLSLLAPVQPLLLRPLMRADLRRAGRRIHQRG